MRKSAAALLVLAGALGASGCSLFQAPAPRSSAPAAPAMQTARAPLFNADGTVARDPATGAPVYGAAVLSIR